MTKSQKVRDLEQRIESLRTSLREGEDGWCGDPYEVLEYMEDELRELTNELEEVQHKDVEMLHRPASMSPIRNFAAVIHYVSMALQFMLDDPDIMTIKAKPLALKAINLSGDTIDYQTAMEIAGQITGRIRRLEMLK